jgi:hypothetical protein
MSARAFGFTLFYRPVGPELVTEPDLRPVAQLPSCQYSTRATEAERDQALVKEGQHLEAQGYRVERVVRESFCVRCEGAGTILVKPKGWRKKSAPPAFACRRQACPACGGGGAEHIVQSVTTLVQAEPQ